MASRLPNSLFLRTSLPLLGGGAFALLLATTLSAAVDDAVFLDAARRGDEARVIALLQQGANPNAATPTGETALQFAAEADDHAAVERLVHAGAKVANNHYGVSPFIAACEHGDAQVMALLLQAGADVNQPMADGRTPLMVAAETGKPAAVKFLLERGATPNAREPAQSQTALMWAAAEGNREAVQLLLQAGAEAGAKSKGGWDAFLFAVRQGHRDVAEVLLQAGVSANDSVGTKPGGASALSLAVTNAHYELGAWLLDAGADPNYTWQGRTVLHILTWVRKPGAGSNDPAPVGSGNLTDLQFVRTLVKHGADVNRRMTAGGGPMTSLNLRGATPFLLAARTADVELMRLLVDLGADPMIPNADDTTPLMAAAGVGVKSPGEDPGTEEEVLAAVKLAVELGNDVNAIDKEGNTAMHGAAFKWVTSVVPYLVEKGAKIEIWNRKNNQGWTPLRIAMGVYRGMNLRGSPQTADAIRNVMVAAGVSTVVEAQVNPNGGIK
jgi:ankyrin repeat protein